MASPVGSAAASSDPTEAVSSPPPSDAVARLHQGFTPENRIYSNVRKAMAIVEPFWDVALALLLLSTGLSARFRDVARRVFHRRYGRVLVYLMLVGLVVFVAHLPLDWARGFWWEHRFGLSNQSGAAWLIEQLKALGLNLAFVGATGLVALALWGVAATGRRWWLWLACGTLPVAVAGVLLQPLVFDPAFNKFQPLGDHDLARRILALAERSDIPARHVFQVDRSRQTNTVNAYVSGFGPSQRIVMWDTTLERMTPDEILFIVGHEIGHYRLGHLWKGVLFTWVMAFAVFFVAARAIDWALARFGARWRVTAADDEAAIPLFVAVLGLLGVLVQPAGLAFSRHIEHEADVFGIEATRLNAAAASTFVKFGEMNRSDPDPPAFLKWWLYSHPTLVERARFAETYRPWEAGRPNRYFHGPPLGESRAR